MLPTAAADERLRAFMEAVREGERVYAALGLTNANANAATEQRQQQHAAVSRSPATVAPPPIAEIAVRRSADDDDVPSTLSEFMALRDHELRRLGLDTPVPPPPSMVQREQERRPRPDINCDWQRANPFWASTFGKH
jgi:hypothetical protein